jgi:hypothetical protein
VNRFLPLNPARSQDFGAASKLCVKSSRVAIVECKWSRSGLPRSPCARQIPVDFGEADRYVVSRSHRSDWAKRRRCARLIIAKVVSVTIGYIFVEERGAGLPHVGQMVNAGEKGSVR